MRPFSATVVAKAPWLRAAWSNAEQSGNDLPPCALGSTTTQPNSNGYVSKGSSTQPLSKRAVDTQAGSASSCRRADALGAALPTRCQ
jgi:hypothetical protein